MITKKLHGLVFAWDPVAFNGKGYWFILGKNGTYARAATSKEETMLGHPKEKFQQYQRAETIGKTSLSNLISDRILGGQSIGSSIGTSVSDKVTSKITNIKRSFDPLNIVRKITGNSRLATSVTARLLGRSMKDARFFLGEKLDDKNESYKVSGSITGTVKDIYKLLDKHFKQSKKIDKSELDEIKKESKLKDKQNKELIDALLGKGKFKNTGVEIKIKKDKKEIPTLGKLLIAGGLIKLADDELSPILTDLDFSKMKFEDLNKLIDEIGKVLKAKAEIVIDDIEDKPISKELKKESSFDNVHVMKKPQAPEIAPKPTEVPKSQPTNVTPPKAAPKSKVPDIDIEGGSKTKFSKPKKTFMRVGSSFEENSNLIPIPKIDSSDKSIMALIEKHEGVRYTPYKDTRGFWTVGVGHYIGKNLPASMNRQFSPQEVQQLFDQDYAKHKAAAEKIPNFNKLNPQGKAALIDITFNMGPTWWKSWPRFTKYMEKDNIPGAMNSLENSKWYTQVGNRATEDVALLSTNENTENGFRLASLSTTNDTLKAGSKNTVIVNNKNVYAMNTNHKTQAMISPYSDASYIHNKLKA